MLRGDTTLLREAIALARAHGSRMIELRAALDLTRVEPAARDDLAAVYASFTEGFELPDLVEARDLLGVAR